jgi:hypothetical protein
MKIYIQLPFLSSYRRSKKIKSISIGAGFYINWDKWDFELCDDKSYFPRGQKNGSHYLTVTFGISCWSIVLTLYKTKKP